MVRAAAVTFAIALSLVACGDQPAVIDDPSEFVATAVLAECDGLVRCGVFATHALCRQFQRQDWIRSHPAVTDRVQALPEWTLRVAAGTMSYSPPHAAACVEALRARVCDDRADLDSCHQVFAGLLETGAVAWSADDCAGGGWSWVGCVPGQCCAGTCAGGADDPAPGPGDVCLGPSECERGMACRGVCTRLGAGDSCATSDECPRHLVCDGQCRPPDGPGQACTQGLGVPRGTCRNLDTYCFDGTCQRYRGEGETCGPAAGSCGPGLHCDPDSRRCAGPVAIGASCADGFQARVCADGVCDVIAAGGPVCVAPSADGEPCASPQQCSSGICSSGGVCGQLCN